LAVVSLHRLFIYSGTPLPVLSPSVRLRQFLSQAFICINSLALSSRLFFLFTPPVKMEQSVPKRRQIEFRIIPFHRMQIYLMLLRLVDIFTTTRLSNNSVHPLVFIFLRGLLYCAVLILQRCNCQSFESLSSICSKFLINVLLIGTSRIQLAEKCLVNIHSQAHSVISEELFCNS
jgi:hypothetical protein